MLVPIGTGAQGLSPRVRGNQLGPYRRAGIERSIPACAGEPPVGHADRSVALVYPRVCGGTVSGLQEAEVTGGLSPRVRGNPDAGHHRPDAGGSIPACAGEPLRLASGPPSGRVYPRVCGGTSPPAGSTFASKGLSPRVRGNPLLYPVEALPHRSIPACAGEPETSCVQQGLLQVYPRVCGGTNWVPIGAPVLRGLSPRVRGNPPYLAVEVRRDGSIPACAGEPCRPRAPPPRAGVYPRVCGGTSFTCTTPAEGTGLSPRVRGNPRTAKVATGNDGSIPACAGEPRQC